MTRRRTLARTILATLALAGAFLEIRGLWLAWLGSLEHVPPRDQVNAFVAVAGAAIGVMLLVRWAWDEAGLGQEGDTP